MIDFMMQHLLTLILFAPVVGVLAVMLVPTERKQTLRLVALLASIVPLVLSIVLWARYDSGAAGFQFEEQAPW